MSITYDCGKLNEHTIKLNERLNAVNFSKGPYLKDPTVSKIHFDVVPSTKTVTATIFVDGIAAQFPFTYSEKDGFHEPVALKSFFCRAHREVFVSFFEEAVDEFLNT